MEFWVHDEALIQNSDYFKELFGIIAFFISFKSLEKENKEEQQKTQKEGFRYIKTYITVPQGEFFWDLLIWIYCKDKKRLRKAAMETESILALLTLGIYLKMKEDYFEALFVENKINISLSDFSTDLWSRKSFTFAVLKKLLTALNLNQEEKLLGLFSWLKADKEKFAFSTTSCQKQLKIELQTSMEVFKVREYIEKHKLMYNLKTGFLMHLLTSFPLLTPVFDVRILIKEYAHLSSYSIHCRICKRTFESAMDVIFNSKCERKLYHPRSFATTFRDLEETKENARESRDGKDGKDGKDVKEKDIKNTCMHLECKRKAARNQYQCCHLGPHVEGCTMGEGTHYIIINQKIQ